MVHQQVSILIFACLRTYHNKYQGKYWKVRASIFQDPVRKIIKPPLASHGLVIKIYGQTQYRRSFKPAFFFYSHSC